MNGIGTLFENKVDGAITERMLDYYEARAKGGVGLMITGTARCQPTVRPDGRLAFAIWDDKYIPGWRDLANIVHRHGAKLIAQIGAPGRQGALLRKDGKGETVAPSPITCPWTRVLPREMMLEEIEEAIESFAKAARRAKEAGVDGVCLHGAHGYLMSNFISPAANRRSDKYGGSLENRLRFPLQVIERVRELVGADYPVMIRLNSHESESDGLCLEDLRVSAPILVEAGFNAVDVSAGTYADFALIIPPAEMRPGWNVASSEAIKRIVDVPVIANGRINNPLVAEQILEEERADFVGMSRAFLTDPEWPKKAAVGNLEDIQECIGCTQGCCHPHGLWTLNPVRCILNPTVGKEKEMEITATTTPKKILVAGGGPAGLEAARVAALRGHHVTLFEKTSKLGGQFAIAAQSPFGQEKAEAVRWLIRQVEKAGVMVKMDQEVTPKVVREAQPDVVIVATGAVPIVPNIPGANKPNVVTAIDILAGKINISGKVVIIGGGLVGCEIADFLGERGVDVTIIKGRTELAADGPMISRPFLLQRLARSDVTIITSAAPREISDDGVVFTKDGKDETIRGCDYVILAKGMKSVNELVSRVQDKGIEVYRIGDAKEPRTVLEAIAEGAEVGREI
jgi:2,4-dienoyl-CoA reductase-like NADH-dependent reductase (Old Yellow Enzyme family)/thioredoxin reductase